MKKKATFVFEKDEVDLWNISALCWNGTDLISGFLSFMVTEVYKKMCSRAEFKDDKRYGQGTLSSADGIIKKDAWKKNELVKEE